MKGDEVDLDELPIDGPIFELRDYTGHSSYDLEIEIDEFVASEFEDVVDELVVELTSSTGVSRVAHEDRERILVASDGTSRERLEAWLATWFRDKLAEFESLDGD
jgi:hypothetical protein